MSEIAGWHLEFSRLVITYLSITIIRPGFQPPIHLAIFQFMIRSLDISSTARMYCEVPNDQCPDHSYLRDILNGVELKAEIVHIPVDDTFSAERKTCMLLGIKEIGSNSALCRKGSRGHLRTSLEIQLRAHPVHHRQVKTSSLPA